jgi:LysM repeat protein
MNSALLAARIKPFIASALLIVLSLPLAGCGQVITLPTSTPVVPTPTTEATAAPTPRPTATPAPYTPAPTATPTPTPTPIFYTIKSGDTLLAIAREYGVTVAALQETNGIADPRALRVNQEIIIPHRDETESEDAEPTPTPTPLPFEVSNLHFGRTPLGGLWCLGEVHNTSGVALEQVQVLVTLLDAEHEDLASESTFVQLDLVAADGRAPFALLFPHAPPDFASYKAQRLGGLPAFVSAFYRDLEVQDVEVEGERYASYIVRGRVVNVGPEDAVGVTLVVTAYDVLGDVIGVRKGVPQHNVVPRGGETSFQLEFVPDGGPVVTTTIQALGQRILPTPATTP